MAAGALGIRSLNRRGSIADFILNRQTFVASLLVATIVPFFIGALTGFKIIGVSWLISLITFIALIHVPMTAYLLSDPAIRAQMAERKTLMIGGTIFIFALSIFMFLSFSRSSGSHYTEILFFFAIATTMWQSWHFGKQNLGVFAFSKIATRTGRLSTFERATLTGGAFCGIFAAYMAAVKEYQKTFSPGAQLGFFTGIMDPIAHNLRWLQYGLAIAALIYVVSNIRRFTVSTAILYLMGVCFFFPQFFSVDFPMYFFIFSVFISAHGAQYMVFLLYHALGSVKQPGDRDSDSQVTSDNLLVTNRLATISKIVGPIFFFCITLAVVSELYGVYTGGPGHTKSVGAFGALFNNFLSEVLGRRIDTPVLNLVASGAFFGVLLSHFWLDSFFWKMKDAGPRKWMQSRYSFLFD